jgi:hypothetical protein
MNFAQVLIAVIGLGASIAAFCLMRFPDYRCPCRYGAGGADTLFRSVSVTAKDTVAQKIK